jgi:hypothetical protein
MIKSKLAGVMYAWCLISRNYLLIKFCEQLSKVFTYMMCAVLFMFVFKFFKLITLTDSTRIVQTDTDNIYTCTGSSLTTLTP